MRVFPQDKKEWLHFAFCTAETIVAGMTCRLFWLHQQYVELYPNSVAEAFYLSYLAAWFFLGVITFRIKRIYPNLVAIGWWTFGVCPLLAGCHPAVN